MFSAALGLVPLWMLSSIAFWGINGLLAVSLWSGLAAAGVSTFLLARYFKARIGGFTGDCLGAVQQVSEVSFYLLVLLVWSLFGNGG
jgi:adenosylcobinamide-GDP ribazoletransferase